MGSLELAYGTTSDDILTAAGGAFETVRRTMLWPWSDVERVLEVYLVQACRRNGNGWVWTWGYAAIDGEQVTVPTGNATKSFFSKNCTLELNRHVS